MRLLKPFFQNILQKMYKNYIVTVTPTISIAGQSNEPEEIETSAWTAADAIKNVRRQIVNGGYDVKSEGKLKFKVRLLAR